MKPNPNSKSEPIRYNRDNIGQEELSALRAGCETAYTRIFLKYYDKIKRFTRTLAKSETAAEEITQEIFKELWEKREKVDPSKNFNGYIYRIARNAVIDHIRSETARNNYTNEYSTLSDHVEYVNSEDIAVAEEVKILIQIAISGMPEHRRRIYEMKHNEGLSNEEIADRLCLQKTTVAKELSYGRADIRNVLGAFLAIVMIA